MYQVYSFESTRVTKTLAMALAWAPLLFQLQGTARWNFPVRVVNLATGETLKFGRKGWIDDTATVAQAA